MTHFLLATDSVHTTAAACDYLAERLSAEDVVTALTVREPGADPRDGGDALNVATVRLGGLATVETETHDGDPATVVLEQIESGRVDEAVLGARRAGSVGASGVGSTIREVVFEADVPVVLVPVERLD